MQSARVIPLSVMLMLMLAGPTLAQHPVPPPPLPEYDPVPGPFGVLVDPTGAIEDAGVLDNAVAGWTGPALSAFSLCIQRGDGDADASRIWQAFREVAHALTARGAAIVVIESGPLCRTPPFASWRNRFYVEVRGVIRAPW